MDPVKVALGESQFIGPLCSLFLLIGCLSDKRFDPQVSGWSFAHRHNRVHEMMVLRRSAVSDAIQNKEKKVNSEDSSVIKFCRLEEAGKKRSIKESKLILLLDREQTSRQTDAVTKEG